MKQNMYAIFDSAAGYYKGGIILMHSDAEAMRFFGNLVANADSDIGKNPEDFSIARFGVYDNITCKVSQENVEYLVTGLEMVAQQQKIAPGSLKNGELLDEVTDGAQLQPGTAGEYPAE